VTSTVSGRPITAEYAHDKEGFKENESWDLRLRIIEKCGE